MFSPSALILLSVSAAADRAASRPWLNASLGVDQRVKLLLAAMTNGEKAAQLDYSCCDDPYQMSADAAIAYCVARGGCGGTLCGYDIGNATACVAWGNAIQRGVIAQSRLG